MKTNKFFQLLTLGICAIALAFVTGCEGPEGPQGPAGTNGADGTNGTNGVDGVNGVDANESCTQCHNETTTVLNAATQSFDAGAHSAGTYYTRGGECAACHNNEGFLARIDMASIAEIGDLEAGDTQISCYTCHSIHQSYTADDWGLTLATQVTDPIYGSVSPDVEQTTLLDIGNSNLCLQCHQNRDRGNVPAPDATEDITTGSTHWGPHYGTQGHVLNAAAGVNVTGSKNYPAQGVGAHAGLDNACAACHMPEGNHSLAVDYDLSCATAGCHIDGDDAEDKQDALHDDIAAMMTAIGAELTANGAMTGPNADGLYSPANATMSADNAKAVWNYMVAYQDHSYGVHNPAYMKALLENTMELIGLQP